ncbi:MAG: VWA domain-containing protein, partial [Thermomicrobiales bacterium]|nr:VWA domain-containing protein [Thermomicrobiales bacterium]
MTLQFANPGALWLLALLLPVAGLGWVFGVRRRRFAPLATWLRAIAIALLAVALAQPLIGSGGGRANTVFLIDRSRSLGIDDAAVATDWLNAALAAVGPGQQAAVVAFGASPKLVASAAPADRLDRAWMQPDAIPEADRDFTDIESALALARALPLGGGRRIVLLSDGAENVGDASDQAAQAAADGVPIDVVPLPGIGDDDLRVEGVDAPASVWFGESVPVLVSVNAPAPGPGRIELWADGERIAVQDVALPTGLSSHAFQAAGLTAGFHALEVRVSGDPALDRFPENDHMPLATIVRGQPHLLLVEPEGGDPGILQGALTRSGAQVTVGRPADLPSRLSDLEAYDGFVLDNVPAADFTLDQLAGLQTAARSLGRGLVVIGGTASYGPGGYAGSLLESALPVTVNVTDGRQRPRVALLLIVDKSGSMSYDPLGSTGKIEMAKEAARLAAGALAQGDEIGILAFNDRQQWVVPLTAIGGAQQREQLDALIAGITAEGGTEMLPALSVGLDAIRNADADVRHIVLLSDGKSRTGTRESYQTLVDDAVRDRTTLSTIAVGEDADTDLLNFLADRGGGRYHFTERPEDIPRVTLQEAQSAGSQSVIRGQFQPIQTAPSPILTAFAPTDLPALDGYDFAEAKPDAQTILTSDRGDPLLAKWQYGLGRVVAWTADNGSDLAAGWTDWQRYDEFWAAVVRWALPDPEQRPLQISVRRDGPEAVVSVEAGADAGDLAEVTADITTPSGAEVTTRLFAQTGPGPYQLRIIAPEPGAYQLNLRSSGDAGVITELAGFAPPPSPELRPAPAGAALLRDLAARTG